MDWLEKIAWQHTPKYPASAPDHPQIKPDEAEKDQKARIAHTELAKKIKKKRARVMEKHERSTLSPTPGSSSTGNMQAKEPPYIGDGVHS